MHNWLLASALVHRLPTIHDQTNNGRQLWRVVVGPAPTTEDRSAVLETVRGLGFGDAYFVAR